MCQANIAWCKYCEFERLINWDYCKTWRQAYNREVKYTHVFSSPEMPMPMECPNRKTVIKLEIRPGSCPSGPTPAFTREEKLRKRSYARNFGYADDSDEEGLDNEEDECGTRGSAKHGCVGYEVRAELMKAEDGIKEWEKEWSHRNLRERLGLEEVSLLTGMRPQERPPQPMLAMSPSPLEALPQGITPPKDPENPIRMPVPRARTTIKWTDQLKTPVRHAPHITSRNCAIADDDDDDDDDDEDEALDLDSLSLGTDSEGSPQRPIMLSPQPQGRKRPIGRENVNLAMPRPRGTQQPLQHQLKSKEQQDKPPVKKDQPFQRPRDPVHRALFPLPPALRQRNRQESYKSEVAPPVLSNPTQMQHAQMRRDRRFNGPMMGPN